MDKMNNQLFHAASCEFEDSFINSSIFNCRFLYESSMVLWSESSFYLIFEATYFN